ncbi:hypothetical protein IIC38_11630 [candidate division KSB1 bacterium]|nr:hypothetical protein [candidate division KSB1 bacterium]
MQTFKHNLINKRLIGFVILAFLSTILLNPLANSTAWAQDTCEAAVAKAEQQYKDGLFDDVIKTLESCLPVGIKDEEKSKAYRLLSLTFLAKDYLDQARDAIRKLLELAPDWQPDPVQDPPPFTNMVGEMRKHMEEEKKKELVEQPQEQPAEADKPIDEQVAKPQPQKNGGNKKFLIGFGVAAIVGGLALALGGGGNGGTPTVPPVTGDTTLPNPPGAPGGN